MAHASSGMARRRSQVWPGTPNPLGATWDGQGTNFALFSENAVRVTLCLFTEDGRVEAERIRLTERTAHVWHAYLPGIRPGQAYGYRVDGPFAPERGHRFNPNKILIDPYAKALVGDVDWAAPVFGYPGGNPRHDMVLDPRDDAASVPKAVVCDPFFDWDGDASPSVPWHDTVIYEVHPKGFTARHPAIPDDLRGTYSGLAHPESISYLKSLGVTAVELLPTQAYPDDAFLVEKG